MYRGILNQKEVQLLAREVWPKFRQLNVIEYHELHFAMVQWASKNQRDFDANAVIGFWVEEQLLAVSPDHSQFRFKERALECLERWNDEDRLWKSGSNKSISLNKRLVAGEPARNIRKIKDLIGNSLVTAVHDPYTRASSLETILMLADIDAKFDSSLRILGTPLANATEKTSLVAFLKNINTERNSHWEIRAYAGVKKPHRRFLILHDGAILTCGMSLNHVDKDEVLDREPSGSEYAVHDCKFFEDKWNIATPV